MLQGHLWVRRAGLEGSPEVKHASCTRSTTSSLPLTSPQIMAVGSTKVLPPSVWEEGGRAGGGGGKK